MAKLSFILFMFTGLFSMSWEHEFSKGGITVWSKAVKSSNFREYKAFAYIPVPPTKLFKGLNESENIIKALSFVTENRDMESCGENCKYVYQSFHKKPVKPRHVVLKVQWKESGDDEANKTYKQWWKKAKNKKPKGNCVEVNWTYGSWHLKAAAKGKKTRLTTTSYMDPGGVSAFYFFVNSGSKQLAWDFIDNIRKAAPKW